LVDSADPFNHSNMRKQSGLPDFFWEAPKRPVQNSLRVEVSGLMVYINALDVQHKLI